MENKLTVVLFENRRKLRVEIKLKTLSSKKRRFTRTWPVLSNFFAELQRLHFFETRIKARKKEIPGPGQYNTDKIRPESPAFSLGKGPRVDFTKLATKTPGPGEYKLGSSFNGKAAKFSSAKRISVFDVESSPGYYKIEKKPDGPFYTIQGKRSENNKNLTPVIII
jgi:Protein of unknown function (DUF1309).